MAEMKYREEILAVVNSSVEPVGSAYVAEVLNISLSGASRRLGVLASQGYLQRIYSSGKGYNYTTSIGKHAKKRIKQSPRDSEGTALNSLSSEQLKTFLTKWSETPWRPKIFNTAVNLPQGLAQLYKYAVQIAYGEPINTILLQEVMVRLQDFRRDLIQTLKIVDAVLSTGQLTSTKDIAVYLLQDLTPDEIDKIADRVIKNNT